MVTDYTLTAPTENALYTALPDHMKDDAGIVPYGHTYALDWNVPTPNNSDFHANLRLINTPLPETLSAYATAPSGGETRQWL